MSRTPPLTPAQRTLRAQIAAFEMHAAGKTNTAPARAAFEQRFVDQVDPDRTLPAEERARRAALAKRAYFSRLALKRSRSRTAKA